MKIPTFKIAKEKYKDRVRLSLEKNLRLFLFNKILLNENILYQDSNIINEVLDFIRSAEKKDIINHFRYWSILDEKHTMNEIKESPNFIQIYDDSCYNINAISIFNEITKKEKEFDESDIFKELLSQYYKMFSDNNFSVKWFCDYYGEDVDDYSSVDLNDAKIRKCYYCGISEKHIFELLESFKINKDFMFYLRGERMEIDKKNPFEDYAKNNIELCCYWCNNAKTNEYTKNEFITIASGIKTIWEERLREVGIFSKSDCLKPKCYEE